MRTVSWYLVKPDRESAALTRASGVGGHDMTCAKPIDPFRFFIFLLF